MTRIAEVDWLAPGLSILAQIDRERSETLPPHTHPHGEFYIVTEGHVLSASADASWLIPAGQAYWAPAGTVHGGTLTNVSGIRLYVAPDLTPDPCFARPIAFSVTPLVSALMQRWGEEAGEGFAARDTDRHRLAILADEMARSIARPVILPLPSHALMRRVMSDWAVECDERIGLDEAAARCRMSRRTFTRQFRAETGMSPGAWMQAARIVHGCRLMASGLSITDTAFALGYESATSFFNLCRRLTGMNPSSLARHV